MHHPSICDIMLIIEDYFILVDDKDSRCQIESIIDTDDEDNHKLGIKISRRLLNGYLYIEIKGEDRDSDELTFNYLQDLTADMYLKSIELECSDYSSDTVREAVRAILILDKNSIKQKSLCQ
jgi:hypothetical protein